MLRRYGGRWRGGVCCAVNYERDSTREKKSNTLNKQQSEIFHFSSRQICKGVTEGCRCVLAGGVRGWRYTLDKRYVSSTHTHTAFLGGRGGGCPMSSIRTLFIPTEPTTRCPETTVRKPTPVKLTQPTAWLIRQDKGTMEYTSLAN